MPGCSYQFSTLTLVFALGLCWAAPATAEIILDEFTDSAMVLNSLSNTCIETLDVGELLARREIRIESTGSSDPYGGLDIDSSDPGRLVACLDRVEIARSITPISAIQFNYYLDPVDVTEGGFNYAILLDFASVTGGIQPSLLRATLWENARLSGYLDLAPPVPRETPFTLAFPIEAFVRGGGDPARPDFTTPWSLSFEFYFRGHSGQLNWEARLDRIRFGPADSIAVPEPAAAFIIVLVLLVWRSVSFGL